MYWQYPANNWGKVGAGLNVSAANALTFWAKGAAGSEKIRFFVGGIGNDADAFPDSVRPGVSTGYIELDKAWHEYTIDLRGNDLSHVVGGFGFATDRCASPNGATFYLDDIRFESRRDLPSPGALGPIFPIYSGPAASDNHISPSGWIGDIGAIELSECAAPVGETKRTIEIR